MTESVLKILNFFKQTSKYFKIKHRLNCFAKNFIFFSASYSIDENLNYFKFFSERESVREKFFFSKLKKIHDKFYKQNNQALKDFKLCRCSNRQAIKPNFLSMKVTVKS